MRNGEWDLFGMSYVELAETNLVLQIVAFVMVLMSYWFKRMKKYILHGRTMLVALVLTLASLFLVMLPSFLSLSESIIASTVTTAFLLAMVHASLGLVVEVLAIFLVGSWHLQKSTSNCIRRKKVMRVTMILWTATFILGVLLFLLLYTKAFG
jgi:uncharacterized membrane protein YozB (DUF420 family)